MTQPIDVPCTTCGAEPGYWCRTASNVARGNNHHEPRVQLAQQAHVLNVACPHCGSARGQPCRGGSPVHRARIKAAAGGR